MFLFLYLGFGHFNFTIGLIILFSFNNDEFIQIKTGLKNKIWDETNIEKIIINKEKDKVIMLKLSKIANLVVDNKKTNKFRSVSKCF